MSHLQKHAIAAGFAFFLVASLFPPWVQTFQDQGISQVRRDAGYHVLFTPPEPSRDHPKFGVAIDSQRLLIEYLVILVAAGGFFVAGKARDRGGKASKAAGHIREQE